MMQSRRVAGVLAVGFLASSAWAAGPRPELVDAKTELSIRRGLAYLAKSQHKRGSWSGGTGYGASYEAAMTGLAGLALLSSGSTPTRGPYATHIRRAIYWVLDQQNRATGLICSRAEESRSMYGHGFCMLFLAECYGMAGSKKLERKVRTALQRGIKLIEGAQSPLGGWIYTPSGQSDEGSVTVTQVQALRACENAGVQVNKKVINKAFAYLQKAKCADGGIAYSARQGGRGGSRPAITAAALACLYSAGQYNKPLTRSVETYIKKRYAGMVGSGRGGHFFYTHLYLAEAIYHHHDERRAGTTLLSRRDWQAYFPKIRDWFVARQNKDSGAWQGDHVGLVYGTSIALIVLQLPYGYLPVVQK